MDIYKMYATDPALEQEGKWIDFGGHIELLIARAHNPRYTRILNQLFEAHKHTLELKETEAQIKEAADRSHKIMAEVMAKSILLGWRVKAGAPEGTQPVSYKGEALAYSPANAEKLLLVKDFQEEVAKRAANFQNFRVAAEAADAKNSEATSTGTSSGVAASTSSSG